MIHFTFHKDIFIQDMKAIHTFLTFPRLKVSVIFYSLILLTYFYSPLIFIGTICLISSIEILYQIIISNIFPTFLSLLLLGLNLLCSGYSFSEYNQSSSLYYYENLPLETLVRNICLINSLSDGLQYVGGKLFGKHLAHPSISPNKTYEGYITSYIISTFLWSFKYNYHIIGRCVILGFIGGIISSITKRDLNIKNWSPLLGSHGGFTDRTDSLTITIILFLIFYDY